MQTGIATSPGSMNGTAMAHGCQAPPDSGEWQCDAGQLQIGLFNAPSDTWPCVFSNSASLGVVVQLHVERCTDSCITCLQRCATVGLDRSVGS